MELFNCILLLLMTNLMVKNVLSSSYMGPPLSNGDCFKDFTYLLQRFSFEQLNFFCQQWRAYNELINMDNTTSGLNPFTVNQQKYLDGLKLNLSATMNLIPLSFRKEIRSMSEDERLLFQVAVRSLKWDKIDGVSKYDLIVILHHPALAPGAYVGAAFLPWHREYLRMCEAALRQVNQYVSLPYWDTTLETGLPDPTGSVIWSDIFLGQGDGVVENGPFGGWTFDDNHTSTPLTRNVSQGGRLMTEDDVDFILRQTNFRQFSACVDLRLEQTNRYMHEWVGGCMQNLYYAPQDPVFFLFHAFIDLIWEDWRRNRTEEERLVGYPPNYEACTKYHHATSPMRPFEPLRNIDGFSELYTQLYYNYQKRPTCSSQLPYGCLSNYLFCNINENKCKSKLTEGSNCTGLSFGNINPCYHSRCINGRCVVAGPGDKDISGTTARVKNLISLMKNVDLAPNSTLMKNLVNNIDELKISTSMPILGTTGH